VSASSGADTAVYRTERLVVRPWTADPGDLERIFAIYSQWSVARWLGATPRAMADPAEARSAVERWSGYNDRDERFGSWAVEVRDSGVVAGTVLYKPLPGGQDEIEVGWHLHPDSWGSGLATEAARGAIQRGWGYGIAQVYAVVYPGNERSLAVCRRLGMTPLGRTSRWYGVELEAFRLDAAGAAGQGPPGQGTMGG
jgi:RimJ/RimL family protein N-acetyltransferase